MLKLFQNSYISLKQTVISFSSNFLKEFWESFDFSSLKDITFFSVGYFQIGIIHLVRTQNFSKN